MLRRIFLLLIPVLFFGCGTTTPIKKTVPVESALGKPNLEYAVVDDFNIEIYGTDGLNSIYFVFINGNLKFKNKSRLNENLALEAYKKEIMDNIEVVIDDIPYRLQFKKNVTLNNKKTTKDYILEFGFNTISESDIAPVLPDKILLRSKRELLRPKGNTLISKGKKSVSYPSISVGTSLSVDSINSSSKSQKYGSTTPPYACFVSFCNLSFGQTSAELAADKARDRRKYYLDELRRRILAKMGITIVDSPESAIVKGNAFYYRGKTAGGDTPELVIKDSNYTGSVFVYLTAKSVSGALYGDCFYVISQDQLQHNPNIMNEISAIKDNIFLEYQGTDTYREGYNVKTCKVFSVNKTIEDVIRNPEKYKHLLDEDELPPE